MDLARLHLGLSFALHGLATLLLVVLSLHLLKLASQTLDFVLVLVDLGLVHVELGGHRLHLRSLLLEILLINRQLLGDFGAWLPGEEVLELDVKLLLLLDSNVLFDDLLGFLDESLLESLDLQEELEGVWVSTLQLSPSVVVEGVLQLFGQGLDLQAFLLEGVSETEYLFLVLGNLRSLCLLDLELALELTDLVLEQLDVFEALIVLDLTLAERDLEDLDLLVEEGQFIVPSDQLGSEDVSLGHEGGVGLLGELMLVDSLLDDAVKLGDLGGLLLEHLFEETALLLLALETLLLRVKLLRLETVLVMFGGQGLVLRVNFVLELTDLVLGNSELLSQLDHLVVGDDEVLSVEVTV